MKLTIAALTMVLFVVSAIAISMESATAHNVPPRYNGNQWGQRCLVPAPRTTPTTCCERTRSGCIGGCGLADESDSWKNACRANCQAAGDLCLQRIQPRPPIIDRPGTAPPRTRD